MYYMFGFASSFNQNLCPWGDIPTFPYDNVDRMFYGSGCTYQSSPIRTNKGPFCASDCNAYGSTSSYAMDGDNWGDDNLYSNSNESPNEPIANESYQLSVTGASLSSSLSTSLTNKPPKKYVIILVTRNAPKFLRNPQPLLVVVRNRCVYYIKSN